MAVQASSRTCKKIFEALSRDRLWELLDHFRITVPDRRVFDGVVAGLVQASGEIDMSEVFGLLGRKELQDICVALGVEAGGREKEGYRAKLVEHLREMQTRARATATSRAVPVVDEGPAETRPAPARAKRARGERTVFIVHGHDDAMRLEIRAFLERLELRAVVLQDEPNKGLTILEKLEKHQAESSFAVVLLSPDDVGYNLKAGEKTARPRARQNVILELGMMIGSLGRGHVAVLYTGDVELPSDIQGLVYIGYERRHADAAKWQLARELKQAGFDVDLNQAL